jgi:hypothetical protein
MFFDLQGARDVNTHSARTIAPAIDFMTLPDVKFVDVIVSRRCIRRRIVLVASYVKRKNQVEHVAIRLQSV